MSCTPSCRVNLSNGYPPPRARPCVCVRGREVEAAAPAEIRCGARSRGPAASASLKAPEDEGRGPRSADGAKLPRRVAAAQGRIATQFSGAAVFKGAGVRAMLAGPLSESRHSNCSYPREAAEVKAVSPSRAPPSLRVAAQGSGRRSESIRPRSDTNRAAATLPRRPRSDPITRKATRDAVSGRGRARLVSEMSNQKK